MSLRSAILILALLANRGTLDRHSMSFSEGDLTQDKKGGEAPKFRCTISTSDVEWSPSSAKSAVSVRIQFERVTEVSVMPSLHLIALPKRHGLSQVEYWAPFDVNSGATTKESQVLRVENKAITRSVRVIPTQLLWASTKSSVWPFQGFERTVRPGRYSVQVQLELAEGTTVRSNEVAITVVK